MSVTLLVGEASWVSAYVQIHQVVDINYVQVFVYQLYVSVIYYILNLYIIYI